MYDLVKEQLARLKHDEPVGNNVYQTNIRSNLHEGAIFACVVVDTNPAKPSQKIEVIMH